MGSMLISWGIRLLVLVLILVSVARGEVGSVIVLALVYIGVLIEDAANRIVNSIRGK